MTDPQSQPVLPPPMPLARAASYSIEPKYWGYVIRTPAQPPASVVAGQSIAWFFGAAMLAAALGVLVLPGLVFGAGLEPMRIALAVLFGAVAVYLLNYASRGTVPHIEVDRRAEEIREVLTHRIGGREVIATYPFRAISGVQIEEDAEDGQATLVLSRAAGGGIPIARGPRPQVERLRDRFARALLGEED